MNAILTSQTPKLAQAVWRLEPLCPSDPDLHYKGAAGPFEFWFPSVPTFWRPDSCFNPHLRALRRPLFRLRRMPTTRSLPAIATSSGRCSTLSASSSRCLSGTVPALAFVRIITRCLRVLTVLCLRVCRFFLPKSCAGCRSGSFGRCPGRSVPSTITSCTSGNRSMNLPCG